MGRRTRLGNQEPTFSTVGRWASTDGGYAADMFRAYGVDFYESQRHELDVFFARKGDGSYAARTICVSKPRQNGKSFGARFYAIWMAAIEGKKVLYSAHHGKTVRKMFKEIRTFVEQEPDFAEMLMPGGQGVYKAAGSEGVYFADDDGRPGGFIEFQTRTASAARGETYDIIVVDEAQELTDDQQEAIKPTSIASGSEPQMIYVGTPPGPKCPGTVFRDMHDRAHEGCGGGVWWMEWAVQEVPDMADRDSVMALVYLTNPAMGHRIAETTMIDLMDTMRPDGFARECLGWWSAAGVTIHPISASDWEACRVDGGSVPQGDPSSYAVKFSPDGRVGCIAACVDDGDALFVECVAERSMRRGVSWFSAWLSERCGEGVPVVIDGRSNAQTLNDKLLEEGVDEESIVRPSTAEVVAANSAFVDATRERAVRHAGQPGLAASATLTGLRKIGRDGGFGFESNEQADATPVEACALAYWRAMSARRDPEQELRIG